MDDQLFDSLNIAYAQAMFEEYARNPEGVPEAWRALFERHADEALAAGLFIPEQLEAPGGRAELRPPAAPPARNGAEAPPAPAEGATVAENLRRALPVISRATALVREFREHGHRLARLDPLGSEPPGHPQLSPAFFGTSMEELEQIPASLIFDDAPEGASVADELRRLEQIYAGTLGYEFEHLDDHRKVDWLWHQVEEQAHRPQLTPEQKRQLLFRLTQAEGLEQFLHRAYLGQKRFSLEGNDALVPMLDLAIEDAARAGGRKVVLGMAHRGRLNVLTHIVGVSYGELLAEFEGPSLKGGQLDIAGTGDVKYHHGARGVREVPGVGTIRVRLAPNPSHLEFVDPVVVGMARALQFDSESKSAVRDIRAVVPVLIHGDAAFAAEGVVAETLNMARLRGFTVGGTVHIIVNNQVGFTTDPGDARSTTYASDLAKGYGIPVVHVNADDPEACLAAVRLAMMYRAEFGDDFVIDLVGYRRHGHNEGDEPGYTQPVLYERIRSHPTVRQIYAEALIAEGTLTREEADEMLQRVLSELREAQDRVREYSPVEDEGPDQEREVPVAPESTGVPFDELEEINRLALTLPEGFHPHPKLWRQLSKRLEDFTPEKKIDWGHAEALALGSLLREGIPIRLTGQDVERGTFSHRHAVLHDVETGEEVMPLQQVADARLEIYNSPLTETAVLGFEYGYSVTSDRDVVLWEAQFGDFVNVAQPVIDQFIASGLAKWGQYSRITMLLPHGYEGQGPEHSSARLERFLQLCAEENLRVTYPTTPAQYFHMLRRQALRRPERPMVVMTPKSLLRLPAAASEVRELTEGTFRHVLDDPTVEDPSSIERLVLLTGKFYYDVQLHPRRGEAPTTAVARQELLYPFPTEALRALIARYPNVKQVVWAQEEPRNMGALTFVGPRLRTLVPRAIPLSYVARPERASPAEGKLKDHIEQQEKLVLETLALKP